MNGNWFVYIGCYAAPACDAIHCFHYNPETGELAPAGVTHTFGNPSYFASRGRGLLYATSDTDDFMGRHDGAVAAFSVDKDTGALELKNMLPAGPATCFLTMDASGRHAYTANYMGGSVSCYEIAQSGEITRELATHAHEGHSANEKRQEMPHVHCLAFTTDWKWLLAADLGTDRVEVYRHDVATGMLERDASRAIPVAAGLGPRHIAVHPGGLYAYVVCEMGNVVIALRYDAGQGSFEPFQQISTLPESWVGESTTAAIRVSADGRFLYASNRGHDSIACFAISPADGTLTLTDIVPSGGRWPRDIVLDPTGKFLFAADQESGIVMRFGVNRETGKLKQPGVQVASVPSCSCICFMQA